MLHYGGRAAGGSASDEDDGGEESGEEMSKDGHDSTDGENEITALFKLMDLRDELLMQIVKANEVTHGSLAFIKALKQTNRRFRMAIRNEMYCNKTLCESVHDVAFVVPGTRIPCNAEHVEGPIPHIGEMNELIEFFLETVEVGPHEIAVGGAFHLRHDGFSSFTWQNDGFIYLAVAISFDRQRFQNDLPFLTETRTTYDISGVPNVIRQHLQLPERTHDAADLDRILHDLFGFCSYNRLLRVRAGHTIEQIFESVAHAEGWNPSDPRVFVVFFGPQNIHSLIGDITEMCTSSYAATTLRINWPNIDAPLTMDSTSNEDEDGSDESSSSDSENDDVENTASANTVQEI